MRQLPLTLVVIAAMAGCDGAARDSKPVTPVAKNTTPEPKQDATPPAVAPVSKPAIVGGPTPADAAEPWGTVKGQIIWGDEKPPPREAVKVPPTHQDHKFCTKDGEFLDDGWVIDAKSKGLKDVFVWLAPAEPGDKLSIHP